MIARNLTPDKNGRPEGGHTLSEFKQIMRRGKDFDHIHPTCTAAQLAEIAQVIRQFAFPLHLTIRSTVIFSKSCHGRRFRT